MNAKCPAIRRLSPIKNWSLKSLKQTDQVDAKVVSRGYTAFHMAEVAITRQTAPFGVPKFTAARPRARRLVKTRQQRKNPRFRNSG
jgi:hypothetical protein